MKFFKLYKFFRRKKYNNDNEELLNKLVIGIIVMSIAFAYLSNEFNTNDLLTEISNNALNHSEFNKDFYEEKNNWFYFKFNNKW